MMKVLGVMSGTSLDGLDLACCHFEESEKWDFSIHQAVTIPYNTYWRQLLTALPEARSVDLVRADWAFGKFIGREITSFIEKYKIRPELIASHGHTIFHQPDKGYTLQIGNGHAIVAETGIPVVYDFRSLDVGLGGQGAPLVPIGDQMLFGDYSYCLNLGGFANVSFHEHKSGRVAFDICPVNLVLNHLAGKTGTRYDNEGKMAASGEMDMDLFDSLNHLEYYQRKPPKSLGKEWVDQFIFPLLESATSPLQDQMHTFVVHIAGQIGKILDANGPGSVLVTGGGAFNKFLVQAIKSRTQSGIIIPDNDLVNYKEAVVFALLGLLRWKNKINCLHSVTGASSDSSSGLIVQPPL
jgi:anhydro-N-acetylmuramic acid kinase